MRKFLFSRKPRDEDRTPDTDILDREEILARLSGDRMLIVRVIDAFVASIPDDSAKLQQAVPARDTERIFNPAHTVKGASLSVISHLLGRIAAAMEAACRDGNIEAAATLSKTFENGFGALKATHETLHASFV